MRLLHRNREDEHTTTHPDAVHDAEAHPVHTTADVDRTAVVPTAASADATRAHGDTKVRERTWTFAPGQLVSLAAGIFAIAVGLIALIRAGVDGSLEEPTVSVLGYDHTAWLGIVEIGVGALLVLAGAGAAGRPLSVLVGALMVVAGVLVLAETSAMPDEFALEREFGWPVAVLGGVVALAALILPVWRTTSAQGRTLDLRDRRTTGTRGVATG